MPKIGDHVRYERLITRRNTPRGHTWQTHEGTPGEGIFIGYRYKQSGSMNYECREYGSYKSSYWAERGERTKVALIAYDCWQDPRTVDPNGLTVMYEVGNGPCYVMADGACISPFRCIHGDPYPLDEFVKAITDDALYRPVILLHEVVTRLTRGIDVPSKIVEGIQDQLLKTPVQ